MSPLAPADRSELERLLSRLEGSVYDPASARRTYYNMDVLASRLAELFKAVAVPDASAPDVFRALGMSDDVVRAASTLARVSAMKWYDEESAEPYLDEAEEARVLLTRAIKGFLLQRDR